MVPDYRCSTAAAPQPSTLHTRHSPAARKAQLAGAEAHHCSRMLAVVARSRGVLRMACGVVQHRRVVGERSQHLQGQSTSCVMRPRHAPCKSDYVDDACVGARGRHARYYKVAAHQAAVEWHHTLNNQTGMNYSEQSTMPIPEHQQQHMQHRQSQCTPSSRSGAVLAACTPTQLCLTIPATHASSHTRSINYVNPCSAATAATAAAAAVSSPYGGGGGPP
jgi:hypothetical protein